MLFSNRKLKKWQPKLLNPNGYPTCTDNWERIDENGLFTNNGGFGLKERYSNESYKNKNHARTAGLHTVDDGPYCNKPSGKGPHLILTGSGSLDGWDGWNLETYTSDNLDLQADPSVSGMPGGAGTVNIWKAKKSSGDYHDNFNAEIYINYFKHVLLPLWNEATLFIIDHASYQTSYPNGTILPLSSTCSRRIY